MRQDIPTPFCGILTGISLSGRKNAFVIPREQCGRRKLYVIKTDRRGEMRFQDISGMDRHASTRTGSQ